MGSVEARPLNCMHIPLQEWAAMTDAQRAEAKRRRFSPTTPSTVPTTPGITISSSATTPLKNIRDWNEEVDGISAERLRYCIIYQLEVRKKDFWTRNMSVAHVRRYAKALDEETPPGWEPNPLISTKKTFDGQEYTDIRPAKTAEEWDIVHSMLFNSRGRLKVSILKLITDKNCPRCHGEGGYKKQVSKWKEVYHQPCECAHENPFRK